MKKFFIIMAIILSLVMVTEEEKVIIPKDSIRFRVVANSNQESDQLLKKKLVTNLSENIKRLEIDSTSLDSSRKSIKKNMSNFATVIEKTLQEEESNSSYDIKYGKNYFPKKEYKGVVYEEGEYESLVITLGEGTGKNFWCVLFPPLCLLEGKEALKKDEVEYTSIVKEIVDKYF